jgi:hypothetical protein
MTATAIAMTARQAAAAARRQAWAIFRPAFSKFLSEQFLEKAAFSSIN